MAGTLALVGAGEFLETMSKVDRLLLDRCGGNKVMILPTAAAPDGDGVPQKWIRLGVDHFNRLGAQAEGLLVLDRSHCDDDGFAAQVAEARARGVAEVAVGRDGRLSGPRLAAEIGRAHV